MDKKFAAVVLVVILFVGYLLGYSIPPFIHSGVFSGREEKGVKVKIDKKTEDYYKNLYEESE
ncbi:MAG: hypothetical protein P8Y66_00965 [Nitrospirota bacterium]|jgi:hypothetical protein